MILTCPACGTQYVVKDGAIPPGGRQVRCASCRHSWHQDPEEGIDADGGTDLEPETNAAVAGDTGEISAATESVEGFTAEEPASETFEDDADVEGVDADHPPLDDDTSAIEEFAAANVDPIEDTGTASAAPIAGGTADEFTPFAIRTTPEPRRRGAAFGVLIAVVLIVLAALAFWYLAPAEWKARAGLAETTATPLQLMMTHSDRQKLASGNELLAISGRVINPTDEKQRVPPITAQLRDSNGKLVYSWTIAPPAPILKAGDSASFYSAEVNVPAGGDELTVTLGAPKA